MVVQRLILCTVLVLYAVSTTGAQVCVEESVRLVDGGLYHGIVEVCVNNQWGTVCADNFGIEEAIVACRQLELGPPPNTDSNVPPTLFVLGVVVGQVPVTVQSFTCTDSEPNLFMCNPLIVNPGDVLCPPAVLACIPHLTPCCLVECPSNSECIEVSSLSGSACLCKSGFTGNGLECIDVDECLIAGTFLCAVGVCYNTIGSYICICGPGFIPSADDPNICEDFDECVSDPTLCQNGECVNTEGRFHCKCDTGYKPSEDERSCVDVDECSMAGTSPCAVGACCNTIGSYICICGPGFIPSADDPNICEDFDECVSDPTLCQNGECVNTEGRFHCKCDTGYKPSEDERSCIDADECGMCPRGMKCVENCDEFFTCEPRETKSRSSKKHGSKKSKRFKPSKDSY